MTFLAESAFGAFFDFQWWQWLLILVVIGLIAAFVVMRKRGM